MTKQTLPLARTSGADDFVLNPESLNKILQLAGNQVETLKYMQLAIRDKMGKAVELADFITEINKLVANAAYQAREKSRADIWSGAPGLTEHLRNLFSQTEFSAFQEFMATSSVDNLDADQIIMDYALSRSAQFMRAYTCDGNALTGEALDSMDTLFNAWLAKNQMISEGGIIYEGTSAGEIKQVKGASVHVNPDKLDALLSGNEFEQYVKEKTTKVSEILIRKNPYVEPNPQVESGA